MESKNKISLILFTTSIILFSATIIFSTFKSQILNENSVIINEKESISKNFIPLQCTEENMVKTYLNKGSRNFNR
jgi:hypothetical protein